MKTSRLYCPTMYLNPIPTLDNTKDIKQSIPKYVLLRTRSGIKHLMNGGIEWLILKVHTEPEILNALRNVLVNGGK